MLLTIQELEQKCSYWQKVLSLQDWDIKIGIYRGTQFKTKETQAECSWVLAKKKAVIKILDHVDFLEDSLWEHDMEQSLVHELLHLHIAPFDETKSGSLEEIMMEQAVDILAKSLASLKRGECK